MAKADAMESRRVTGRNIRRYREAKDMRQYELAEKANIKPPFLSQIESGQRGCSISTLSHIAAALGVTLEMLLDGDGPEQDTAVPA